MRIKRPVKIAHTLALQLMPVELNKRGHNIIFKEILWAILKVFVGYITCCIYWKLLERKDKLSYTIRTNRKRNQLSF